MATATRDAVEELLQTYGETGGINYLAAAASLPSRLSIEAACTELMSLMFPGFRSEALVSSEDLADTTRYARFFSGMLERGIYLAPSQNEAMFLSTAHGDEEIDRTVAAVAELHS